MATFKGKFDGGEFIKEQGGDPDAFFEAHEKLRMAMVKRREEKRLARADISAPPAPPTGIPSIPAVPPPSVLGIKPMPLSKYKKVGPGEWKRFVASAIYHLGGRATIGQITLNLYLEVTTEYRSDVSRVLTVMLGCGAVVRSLDDAMDAYMYSIAPHLQECAIQEIVDYNASVVLAKKVMGERIVRPADATKRDRADLEQIINKHPENITVRLAINEMLVARGEMPWANTKVDPQRYKVWRQDIDEYLFKVHNKISCGRNTSPLAYGPKISLATAV